MFDYIDLTEDKIASIKSEGSDAMAAAGLAIMHGARKGILTQEEAAKQAHNLFLAILENESE